MACGAGKSCRVSEAGAFCRHGIHCNPANLADLRLHLLGGCVGALLGIGLRQDPQIGRPVWNPAGVCAALFESV